MCVLVHGSRRQRPLLELMRYKTMVAVELVSGTAPSMKLRRTLQTTGARRPSPDAMLTSISKHTKVCPAAVSLPHMFWYYRELH